MTKAELLKLLEPFPGDTLVVVDTGYAEIEGWKDLSGVADGFVAVNPEKGDWEAQYVEPASHSLKLPPDLPQIPALFII